MYFVITAPLIDLTPISPKKHHKEKRYWMKKYSLFISDLQVLLGGEWLSDTLINCAQALLKRSYPRVGGLQMTTLALTHSFKVERGEFVKFYTQGKTTGLQYRPLGAKRTT